MATFNRDKSANPQPDRPTEDNNRLLELYNQLVAEVSLRINEGKSEATILQEIQPIFTQIDQADLSDHVKRMVEENNWQVNSYIEGDSELPAREFGESSQTQLLRGLIWLAFFRTARSSPTRPADSRTFFWAQRLGNGHRIH